MEYKQWLRRRQQKKYRQMIIYMHDCLFAINSLSCQNQNRKPEKERQIRSPTQANQVEKSVAGGNPPREIVSNCVAHVTR